jgi:hypothetical protein
MPRGEPTTTAKVVEFRAKFLELANARAAARAVGLPETTGIDLARKAEKDPAFVQERSEVYERGLAEVESAMLLGVRIARDRVVREPIEHDNGVFDNGPQWLQAIVAAYKGMSQHRRISAEAGVMVTAPEITITTVPRAKPEGGGE